MQLCNSHLVHKVVWDRGWVTPRKMARAEGLPAHPFDPQSETAAAFVLTQGVSIWEIPRPVGADTIGAQGGEGLKKRVLVTGLPGQRHKAIH